MPIQLSTDQVVTMAPDASSTTAARKLASQKSWQNLGQSQQALWGECQGSALYQVKIALSTLTIVCSCPSRKHPCKHGLGLLLLAVNSPAIIPTSEPPEWVTSWLNKRATTSQRKATPVEPSTTITPSTSQNKTAEKRLVRVKQGIEQLDLWLNDLVRNGLGSLEIQPASFWESQAAQMVDAQAPGIASLLRSLANIPNSSSEWPSRLLAQLGRLALLTEAFDKLEQLPVALQEDIRLLIGWTLKEDEVMARGEHSTDTWLFLGQNVEERENRRTQITWLISSSSRRPAQILQYAFANAPFPKSYLLGIRQPTELVYWPGVCPQRALIVAANTETTPIQDPLPGVATIDAFLVEVAAVLAKNPWRESFLCTLNDAILIHDPASNRWYIRDTAGMALPLSTGQYWQLLALSAGQPVDFAGVWNGETLLPLGILVNHSYYLAHNL